MRHIRLASWAHSILRHCERQSKPPFSNLFRRHSLPLTLLTSPTNSSPRRLPSASLKFVLLQGRWRWIVRLTQTQHCPCSSQPILSIHLPGHRRGSCQPKLGVMLGTTQNIKASVPQIASLLAKTLTKRAQSCIPGGHLAGNFNPTVLLPG